MYKDILRNALYRNARYMCIILVANIFRRSGHAIVRPLFQISPLSTVVADLSLQYLCYSYVT